MTLRVGLLQCDHIAAEVRIAGDYPELFAALFARAGVDVELVVYDVPAGELPEGPDAEDAWLIGGSVASVFDPEPWIADLLEFIRELHAARRPTVGICFGHQALAQALGGATRRSPQGWGVGVHAAEVLEPRTWMTPALEVVRLPMVHRDQVVRVPDGGRVLARSAHCEVAVLEVDGVMLGIQGHPEFGVPFAEVLTERIAGLPTDVAAAARASFTDEPDAAAVGRWIIGFLAAEQRRALRTRPPLSGGRAGTAGARGRR